MGPLLGGRCEGLDIERKDRRGRRMGEGAMRLFPGRKEQWNNEIVHQGRSNGAVYLGWGRSGPFLGRGEQRGCSLGDACGERKRERGGEQGREKRSPPGHEGKGVVQREEVMWNAVVDPRG